MPTLSSVLPDASTRPGGLSSHASWIVTLVLVAPVVWMATPRAAGAQELFGATAFTRAEAVSSAPTVNVVRCEENRALAFRWSLDQTPSEDQSVRITTNDAETCAAGSQIEIVAERAAATGDQTVDVAAEQLLPECPEVEGENRYVCMHLFPVSGTTDGVRVFVPVAIDTLAPEPPDRLRIAPGDEALHVSWEWTEARPADLASVRVFHRRAEEDTEPTLTTVAGAAVTGTRLGGLTNGATYEIWVAPVDEAGNIGEISDTATGTPQETRDFWEIYREQGGLETGGCASGAGGAGPLALLLVALAGLAMRTRRHAPAASLRLRGGQVLRRAGVLMLAAGLGLGAVGLPAKAEARADVEDASRWFLEIDAGPYRPEVDREFEGTGPYEEIFGGGSETLVRLRVERSLWQGVGQLGTGLSAGFAQAVGRAQFADGDPSPEATVFSWVPLQLSLTYRFDYAAHEWGIPLVPYARAGLAYTLWWVTGPDGLSHDADGNRGMGGRAGWFYGGGLKFLLNVIDPRLAADFRRSSGVHHTYLYLELTRMNVDGFGSDGFVLSDSTWFAGLAIEF